ncbi:hypothetical protein M8818_004070 [Zalaria obscura]|uniref:Uncharacterized protein n=1 Tax=Zalaria obscura TaxID=2024903 RepID=A0ACC3SD78_9PEZI
MGTVAVVEEVILSFVWGVPPVAGRVRHHLFEHIRVMRRVQSSVWSENGLAALPAFCPSFWARPAAVTATTPSTRQKRHLRRPYEEANEPQNHA